MANKEVVALKPEALKTILTDTSQSVLTVCEECAQIRVICSKLLSDDSVRGGDGEEILGQFEAVCKAVENVSIDLNKLAKALGMKENIVEDLMHRKFSAMSEESANALEKSSRLKKM